MDREMISKLMEGSMDIKRRIAEDQQILDVIEKVCKEMERTFRGGGKVLFCGNGGSAADAQHLAGELSGKFLIDRDPLFAEALHSNSSHVTAVANDFSYDVIFERLVKAMGRAGDILVGISTSGNSANVINALQEGKKQGMITVGFSGEGGGKMKDICDYLIAIPSKDTPRIQEAHILVGHIICEIVEKNIFSIKTV